MIPDTLKTGSAEVKEVKSRSFLTSDHYLLWVSSLCNYPKSVCNFKKTRSGPACSFLRERLPYLSSHRDRQVFECLSWKRLVFRKPRGLRYMMKKCQNS